MKRKTGLVTHGLSWWLRKPRSSSHFSCGLLGCHSSESHRGQQGWLCSPLSPWLAELPRGVWEMRLDENHLHSFQSWKNEWR